MCGGKGREGIVKRVSTDSIGKEGDGATMNGGGGGLLVDLRCGVQMNNWHFEKPAKY